MAQNDRIRSREDLARLVNRYGFLPFFKNLLPGFSVEEKIEPELWFTSLPGPWEWKGPLLREDKLIYGKFFGKRAVFMTREFFTELANYRRDGYDFDALWDDEKASFKEKRLFDLIEQNAPVLSTELKAAGGYGKDGKTDFDATLTRLQTLCYAIPDDFVYATDKSGKPYGWGTARFTTPEKMMGKAFTEKVYEKKPEESYRLLFTRLKALFPEAPEKTLKRFLG